MGVQSPKLLSENNHSVKTRFFRTPSQSRGGGGWVGVQSPKQIHGILSEKLLIFSKKIKCSKQPKKQNKLNFYFSLSGVLTVRGGRVGSDVWDKVLKKRFFFATFP